MYECNINHTKREKTHKCIFTKVCIILFYHRHFKSLFSLLNTDVRDTNGILSLRKKKEEEKQQIDKAKNIKV